MITEFIQTFDINREVIKDKIRAANGGSYEDLVRFVVEAISQGNSLTPDPDRIHCINDGDYQGTLLFVIASGGYQPSDYWAVTIGYGSCSWCDTLQAIQEDLDTDQGYNDSPNERQVEQYSALCLHMIQNMVKIGGGDYP